MYIRRSAFDPRFWEVVENDVIIQELQIEFQIYETPESFIDLEAIITWLQETEYKYARKKAFSYLARKSYSKAMLLQKLREKKFSQKTCVEVIQEIEKLGYLSDEDFAKSFVEQKVRQGYGPHMIKRFLQEKGLDCKNVKMDQKAAMQKWAQKLRGKDRSKKTAFLLRKGFDFELIRSVF